MGTDCSVKLTTMWSIPACKPTARKHQTLARSIFLPAGDSWALSETRPRILSSCMHFNYPWVGFVCIQSVLLTFSTMPPV